jgi:hypothetical protein
VVPLSMNGESSRSPTEDKLSSSDLSSALMLVLSGMKKDVTIVTIEMYDKRVRSVCSLGVVPSSMNQKISQLCRRDICRA